MALNLSGVALATGSLRSKIYDKDRRLAPCRYQTMTRVKCRSIDKCCWLPGQQHSSLATLSVLLPKRATEEFKKFDKGFALSAVATHTRLVGELIEMADRVAD